jgi:hypothetical protein
MVLYTAKKYGIIEIVEMSICFFVVFNFLCFNFFFLCMFIYNNEFYMELCRSSISAMHSKFSALIL